MRGDKGFALIDAVTGMLILSMGLVCIAGFATTAQQSLKVSQKKMQAVNLLQSELEQIEAMGLEQAVALGKVVPGGKVESDCGQGLKLEASSAWEEDVPALLRLKLTVSWPDGARQRSISFDTLLSGR